MNWNRIIVSLSLLPNVTFKKIIIFCETNNLYALSFCGIFRNLNQNHWIDQKHFYNYMLYILLSVWVLSTLYAGKNIIFQFTNTKKVHKFNIMLFFGNKSCHPCLTANIKPNCLLHFASIFLLFFFFQLFAWKSWKSLLRPALGVPSNQRLVKIYNNFNATPNNT